MISIWDMVVSSGYPTADGTIEIGIGMFVSSMLISLITLPIIICLVDVFYDRKLKVRLGGDKEKKYEIDYYRVTICFLVGIIILMLLNIVMSAHGIFFLSKMYMYEPYLHKIKDYEGSDRNMYNYIVPSNHYVLYFLEAAYEAATENLILWGFLFLVNFISKLSRKDFYFKTFTFFLIIRVLFVFVCHFNIWELITNSVDPKLENAYEFHKFALAIYPYHTSPKTLRVAEILCSLIVFSAFAIYTWKLTTLRMRELTEGIFDPLLGQPNAEAELIIEIKFVRKYLIGYTLFLVIHLFINIIECHFISLYVDLKTEVMTKTLLYLEMGLSIFADVLAFFPPFLFLIFITLIAYFAVKNRVGRQTNEEDEEPKRFRKKRLLLTIPIIIFCSVFFASFIGYLRFTDGDDMQVRLHPGDYLVINPSDNTSFSDFLRSCDIYELSGSPTYQLDYFDFLEYYYGKINKPPLDNTRILRYETYEENNKTLQQEIHLPPDVMYMWFPANTYFLNISESINFTVVPYPYPCYHDFIDNQGTPNDGLRILSAQYTEIEEEYLYCTKNEPNASDKCRLDKDSIISSEEYIPFSLTAVRPFYTGKKQTTEQFLGNGSLIEFNRTIPYMRESSVNEEIFYLTCHHNQWVAAGILVGILGIMGLYLTLGYICLINSFSRVFYSLK